MPKFVTQQEAAQFLGVTDRTIRNLISRGVFTGYKIPGVRAIRVDLHEIAEKMRTIPSVRSQVQKKPFGPQANIVTVRRQAVVVPDEADQ
jgi:excisionase family DNA binding protein